MRYPDKLAGLVFVFCFILCFFGFSFSDSVLAESAEAETAGSSKVMELYDIEQVPSEYQNFSWPTLPQVNNEVHVSSVEQFNQAASHPGTRIWVDESLQGYSVINASDIDVIAEEGVDIDVLYINSGVKRIRINGGGYNELAVKAPVSFWPEYMVYPDRVVEDLVIENVKFKSEAYYAFYGMARRLALLNNEFQADSSSLTSESPEGVLGEDYIIAGNQFYSNGALPNISISGASNIIFVDNVIIAENEFNSVNVKVDEPSAWTYIARNRFVGTGLSLLCEDAWVEKNVFYHNRGTLLDTQFMRERLTVIDNVVFSDLSNCLLCDSHFADYTSSNNVINPYRKPAIELGAYFEGGVIYLSEPASASESKIFTESLNIKDPLSDGRNGDPPAHNLLDDTVPASICGNGRVEGEEVCDDGNLIDNDGCSSACMAEKIQEPAPAQVCGNGVLEIGEICDDGNTINGDGCASNCSVEKRASAKIGVDLNWNYDFIQQWMFVDAMKYVQAWRTRSVRGWKGWDTQMNTEIKWRADGYPVEVPSRTSKGPQIVFAVLLFNHELAESTWPSGQYSVFFEGDGELDFAGDATIVSQTAGQYRIMVQPRAYVELRIIRSNRLNPIRNIRVIMPGFESTYAYNPFHPLFLERLGGIAAVKFTHSAVTDFHSNGSWSSRVTPDYFSQGTQKGVALEYMVQLANLTRKDPWFNLPHRADDEYVRHYAEYLRDHIDPDLTVYLEYSNALWNEAYSQSIWLRERGCKDQDTFIPHIDGIDYGARGCDDYLAGIRATAKRLVEVFSIFDDVFKGQTHRIVKVIGGSMENSGYNDSLWDNFCDPGINPAGLKADAIAIAPYFGNPEFIEEIFESSGSRNLTVNAVLDLVADDLRTNVGRWINFYGYWARLRNLKLLAYEAGNDLTLTHKGLKMAQIVENASRHPRMGELYLEYIDQWNQAGGDLMIFSNYVGMPGAGATNGLLEYQNQPVDDAFMYKAAMWAAGNDAVVAVCGDGVVQAWEVCDDGNRTDRDGCTKYCTIE